MIDRPTLTPSDPLHRRASQRTSRVAQLIPFSSVRPYNLPPSILVRPVCQRSFLSKVQPLVLRCQRRCQLSVSLDRNRRVGARLNNPLFNTFLSAFQHVSVCFSTRFCLFFNTFLSAFQHVSVCFSTRFCLLFNTFLFAFQHVSVSVFSTRFCLLFNICFSTRLLFNTFLFAFQHVSVCFSTRFCCFSTRFCLLFNTFLFAFQHVSVCLLFNTFLSAFQHVSVSFQHVSVCFSTRFCLHLVIFIFVL